MQTYAHGKDPHHALMTPQKFKFYIEQGIHTDGHTSLTRRPAEVPLPAPDEVLQRLGLL
jgi:hypothetical protein